MANLSPVIKAHILWRHAGTIGSGLRVVEGGGWNTANPDATAEVDVTEECEGGAFFTYGISLNPEKRIPWVQGSI